MREPLTGLVIRVAVGEEVRISDNIRFVVIGHKGKQIIITIQAPRNIKIEREYRNNKVKFKEAIS